MHWQQSQMPDCREELIRRMIVRLDLPPKDTLEGPHTTKRLRVGLKRFWG